MPYNGSTSLDFMNNMNSGQWNPGANPPQPGTPFGPPMDPYGPPMQPFGPPMAVPGVPQVPYSMQPPPPMPVPRPAGLGNAGHGFNAFQANVGSAPQPLGAPMQLHPQTAPQQSVNQLLGFPSSNQQQGLGDMLLRAFGVQGGLQGGIQGLIHGAQGLMSPNQTPPDTGASSWLSGLSQTPEQMQPTSMMPSSQAGALGASF